MLHLVANALGIWPDVPQQDCVDLVKSILENPDFDIDYNVVDHQGDTPLHHASRSSHTLMVKFYLENSDKMGLDLTLK